jgi:pilus assembly protein TadC
MPMNINNLREWRTSAVGLILIILSLIDLWKFNQITGELFGLPLQVIGLVAGFLLLLLPDTILSALRKRIRKKADE